MFIDRDRKRTERAHGSIAGKWEKVRRPLPQKPENSVQVMFPSTTSKTSCNSLI